MVEEASSTIVPPYNGAFNVIPVLDVKWSFGAFKQVLKTKLKIQLDTDWKCGLKNETTKELIPDLDALKKIQKLASKKNVKLLHWFLSGSCPLNNYLFLIKKKMHKQMCILPES